MTPQGKYSADDIITISPTARQGTYSDEDILSADKTPDKDTSVAGRLKGEGFLESAWNGAKGMAMMVPSTVMEAGRNVIHTLSSPPGSGQAEYDAKIKQMRDVAAKAKGGDKESRDRMIAGVPGGSTAIKVREGNYAGAAGDLAAPVVLGLAAKGGSAFAESDAAAALKAGIKEVRPGVKITPSGIKPTIGMGNVAESARSAMDLKRAARARVANPDAMDPGVVVINGPPEPPPVVRHPVWDEAANATNRDARRALSAPPQTGVESRPTSPTVRPLRKIRPETSVTPPEPPYSPNPLWRGTVPDSVEGKPPEFQSIQGSRPIRPIRPNGDIPEPPSWDDAVKIERNIPDSNLPHADGAPLFDESEPSAIGPNAVRAPRTKSAKPTPEPESSTVTGKSPVMDEFPRKSVPADKVSDTSQLDTQKAAEQHARNLADKNSAIVELARKNGFDAQNVANMSVDEFKDFVHSAKNPRTGKLYTKPSEAVSDESYGRNLETMRSRIIEQLKREGK